MMMTSLPPFLTPVDSPALCKRTDLERLWRVVEAMEEGVCLEPGEGATYASCHEVGAAVWLTQSQRVWVVVKNSDWAAWLGPMLCRVLREEYSVCQITMVDDGLWKLTLMDREGPRFLMRELRFVLPNRRDAKGVRRGFLLGEDLEVIID